jgi:hypothetical protein
VKNKAAGVYFQKGGGMMGTEDQQYVWLDADGRELGGLIIDSAEGVTCFQGFNEETDPAAEARLQAKLGELAEKGPVQASPELD